MASENLEFQLLANPFLHNLQYLRNLNLMSNGFLHTISTFSHENRQDSFTGLYIQIGSQSDNVTISQIQR